MTLSEPGLGVWQEVIKGVLGSENEQHHSGWGSLKRCCPLKRKKQTKKQTQQKPKVASYVSFRDLSEPTAWDTASHIAPRNCSKELREEPGYLGAFTGERQHTHTCKHPTPTTQKKKKRKPTPYCHTGKENCQSQRQTSRGSGKNLHFLKVFLDKMLTIQGQHPVFLHS